MYNILIKNNDTPTCQEKWDSMFDIDLAEWKQIYSWVFKVCKDTYLQWLQSRIIHRILGTNALLYKMNKCSSDLCTFCQGASEIIYHLFWDAVFLSL